MRRRISILKIELNIQIEAENNFETFLKTYSVISYMTHIYDSYAIDDHGSYHMEHFGSENFYEKSYLENLRRRLEILKISTWAAFASSCTHFN